MVRARRPAWDRAAAWPSARARCRRVARGATVCLACDAVGNAHRTFAHGAAGRTRAPSRCDRSRRRPPQPRSSSPWPRCRRGTSGRGTRQRCQASSDGNKGRAARCRHRARIWAPWSAGTARHRDRQANGSCRERRAEGSAARTPRCSATPAARGRRCGRHGASGASPRRVMPLACSRAQARRRQQRRGRGQLRQAPAPQQTRRMRQQNPAALAR